MLRRGGGSPSRRSPSYDPPQRRRWLVMVRRILSLKPSTQNAVALLWAAWQVKVGRGSKGKKQLSLFLFLRQRSPSYGPPSRPRYSPPRLVVHRMEGLILELLLVENIWCHKQNWSFMHLLCSGMVGFGLRRKELVPLKQVVKLRRELSASDTSRHPKLLKIGPYYQCQ